MILTFEELIAHNKRMSFVLILAIGAFFTLCCGVFSAALVGSETDLQSSFIFGLLLGSGASVVGSAFSYFFGASVITATAHARAVTRLDDPQLVNIVEEVAIAAGVPCPSVYIMQDPSPNAFATGRDPDHAIVCVTSGLREKLSRNELQAVVAHEIAHIKNYDILLMMLVGVFAGIIVMAADLFSGALRNSRHRRSGSTNRSNTNSGGAVLIFFLLGVILSFIAPLMARFLQLAVSREREYLADATAVQFCRNPIALADALRKIATDPDDLDFRNKATEHLYIINPDPNVRLSRSDIDSVWSTHPPLAKRIARLEALHQGAVG